MSGHTGPLIWLLVASGALLTFLVASIIGRKLRRDVAEAAALGRRSRLAQALSDGDDEAVRGLARECRADLGAQRDLGLACAAVDPLPAARLACVHEVLDELLIGALIARLAARDPVARGQAAIVLARLRVPEAERLVAPLLTDSDPDVRLSAVGCLAWLASDAAASRLVTALAERVLPPERLVERLGEEWALPTVIGALEAALQDDGSVMPREWLARALGLAGDVRAEVALVELLRVGGIEERISAARALASCGGQLSEAPLIAAIADPEWAVRGQAAGALGALGSTDAVPALTDLLVDPAWWVRARSAEALSALGEAGLGALESVATEHPDKFARDRAREALALRRLAEVPA